jgi:hypothetical protein
MVLGDGVGRHPQGLGPRGPRLRATMCDGYFLPSGANGAVTASVL